MLMLPETEELTKSIHDLLYGLSGMMLITGGLVGIIRREPLKIIIGSIPLVIVLIVLNGLIVGALVSILALMIIAYLVLVYTQPESEADHDEGGGNQRSGPPTIDTLRGGQPVIVSTSSAAPKVLDDVTGDVKPGKRKVILD
ncbi:hypothetical protein ACV1DG_22965 [Aeromonas hydrophila]|nr:hypothetical protein [Klebsiella pneumoniae]HCG2948063.1 hypothetical protein [Klebsiella pneumoniae]